MATRRERVVLDLEDKFSGGMVKAAASAALLDKSLKKLDGTNVSTTRSLDRVGTSARSADKDINKLTGRLRLFRDIGITLGPALAPIGAVAIPAITGLAAQFGAAAIAGGTTIIAFQGVGDALKAVNDAALDPTVENLEKARDAMKAIGPHAREFVAELQAARPAFQALRDSAAAGLFPGLTESLDEFLSVAPQLERVLYAVGDAAGDMAAEFAEGISGPRGQEFLAFIEDEAPKALEILGRTVGNIASGMAEMWMAFTPLNNDFAAWMLDVSESFDRWADGLAETEGFQNFVEYLRVNGPRVGEALGAIGNALVEIVTAAAPLGGPTLMAIEAFADAIALIAGSDAGPPLLAALSAMTLLNRATSTFGRVSKTAWAQNARGANGAFAQFSAVNRMAAQTAAGVGLLALSMTDLDEKAGLSNTAMGALVGTMIAPGIGSAIGALIGGTADLAATNDDLEDALVAAQGAINSMDYGQMESALKRVNDEQGKQNALIYGLGEVLPGLGDAYSTVFGKQDESVETTRDLNVAMAAAEGRTTGVTSATHGLSNAAARYTLKAERQVEAMREVREAARSTAEEFLAFGDSLDDAKVSLSQWLRQMENQASALRNFRLNAEKAAKRGLEDGLIAKLREAGVEGAMRMRQLANGTEESLDRANAAFKAGERQSMLYGRSVLGIPKSANTKVTADTRAALSGIGVVKQKIIDLNGDTATVYVRAQVADIAAGIGGMFKGSASGGTVPRTGLPYADRHPYMLADGEEVISNRHGQADRNRELLKAINNNGYANGGTVGSHSRAATSVSVGGAQVRVFIDGSEVRAVVQQEISSDRTYQRATGPRTTRRGRPE